MSDSLAAVHPVVLPPDGADRRLRVYSLGYHTVLDAFARMGDDLPAYARVPRLDLPAGSKVLAVHEDWMSRTFGFLVQHPAFDPVPEGAAIPRADRDAATPCETVRLAVAGSPDLTDLADILMRNWSRWEGVAEEQARAEGDPGVYDDTLRTLVKAELARLLSA